MKSDKKTKEYLEKLSNLKLSDSSRARMENNLKDYVNFHTVQEGVRAADESRSIKQVPFGTALQKLRYSYMPIAILLTVMIGGGTSLAAQGSVPGDFLYPVKTEINESVRSAFAIGAESEAKLQADLVEERVEEAEELKAEGKLTAAIAAELSEDIRNHSAKANSLQAEQDDDGSVESSSKIAMSLNRFNALVESDIETGDGNAVLATKMAADTRSGGPERNEAASADTAVATSLALAPVSLETLRTNTEARVDAIAEVIEKYRAELSAEVYASLKASVEEANELMAEAKTQSEEQARTTLMAAADAIAKAEAKLTTLGKAKIDVDTGAIVDMDFSAVPLLDADAGFDADADGDAVIDADEDDELMNGGSGSSVNVETDAEVETRTLEEVETEADMSATSGLRL